MLIAIAIATAIFFAVAFLAPTEWHRGRRYSAASIALASFCVGFVTHVLMPGTLTASASAAPQAAAPAAALPGANGPAKPVNISSAILHSLTVSKDRTVIGTVDSLSASSAYSQAVTTTFTRGGSIYVRGWCADGTTHVAVAGVIAVIDSNRLINAVPQYGGERDDVASFYHQPPMTFTGYNKVEIKTAQLSKGTHTLQMAAVLPGDLRHYYPFSRPISFVLR